MGTANQDARTTGFVGFAPYSGLAIIVAIALVLYALSWNPVSAGFLSDDAIYLMMADGFSPFHQTDAALHAYVLRQSIFPPGYPILLALLGGGSDSLLWSHFVTTSTLVVALVFLWRWANAEIGNEFVALGVVVVYALLPGTLLQNLELMSEFPYLMFSFAALYGASREDQSERSSLFVAICVGLAAATRSAGYSLVIALAIWLFGKRIRGRFALMGFALVPGIGWIVYKTLFSVNMSGGYSQFWTWLFAQIGSEGFFTFVPRYLAGQASAMWHGLLMNLDLLPSTLTRIVAAAILVTALPIFLRRLRRWELDAWYLGAACAMTVLYPFPEHFTRLMVPLIPILLAYSYFCAKELTLELTARSQRLAIQYGVTAALLLSLASSLTFMLGRYFESVDPSLTSWKHTSYWFQMKDVGEIRLEVANRQLIVDASRGLRERVPEGQCILAIRTALTMLYSHRIVQTPPPPSQASGDRLQQRVHNCPNVFLLGTAGHVNQELVSAYYPSDELAADAMQVVQSWDNPASPDSPIGILLREKSAK
jgi:hypothetical protein